LLEVSDKTWHRFMLTMYTELLLSACSLYRKSYESYRTQERVDKMIGLRKSDEILTTCKHRELILVCKYSGKIHMNASAILALKLMFYLASKLAVDQHV
jgi:hypothetical protein